MDDLAATVVWRDEVSQALLHIVGEDVCVGDWVLVSRGYVMRKIEPEDLAETLAMYEALLADAAAATI